MPAWRQMSLTGTPASACLRIETIWVSVNFDFFMEPPGWENMPESSTFVVSADQGSLRKALGYLGLSRRIASYMPRQAAKDQAVAERLLAASPKVPRFGYRRMAAWLDLGEGRVRRLWRQLGLNIPR